MNEAAQFDRIVQQGAEAFRQCSDLPFAAFLVGEDGTFLRYNEIARALFGLPAEPSFRDNITTFYLHPDDRRENLRRLSQMPRGEWLRNTTLDLKIGPVVKHVRDHTLAIWDETGRNILGLLCLIVEMTKSDRYDRLLSDLPVGIFCFRLGAGLVHANRRFCEMHGYDSLEEVRHKEPDAFTKNASAVKELTQRLAAEEEIADVYLENVRRDGSVFTASVSAKAMRTPEGRLLGFEGIVEDVSTADIYFKLVNEVPIGLFKVRISEEGAHRLIHCNRHFADTLGAEGPEALIGQDLRDFYKSEADFNRFFEELTSRDERGESLSDYLLEAYDQQGELRKFELYAKLLKDPSGEHTGLVGAGRDVTDYWDTKQQLEELTTDFGKVLHSYSSTLINSKHSMSAVTRALVSTDEHRPGQPEKLDLPTIMQKITGQIATLDGSLQALLEKNGEINFFDSRTEYQLGHLRNLLQNGLGPLTETQKLATIRDGSIRIRELTQDMGRGNFPRELTKQVRRQLQEILRLCSLITLTHGVEAVLEMETGVDNLRSYILTRVKKKAKRQQLDLYDILLGVARNLGEYAAKRNVELRMNLKDISKVYIQGYREDLTRALLNIVHNAIKYSWTRKSPARSFVRIEGRKEWPWLYLEIENWGVAITDRELADGLIFRVGYRGVNSRDRRRPGTGLGLYDARKVIRRHDGELSITSNPSLGNPADDYSNPFITKVTIKLPLEKPSV